MLRCTIEMVPYGDETKAHTLGMVEIANTGGDLTHGTYKTVLKKTPPFKGALKAAWKKGDLFVGHDDQEIIVGGVEGFHRQNRGVYDLLFLALKACGLDRRNDKATISEPEEKPLTPHVTMLVLLGVSIELTEEEISTWTMEQMELAVDWASACIAVASDNEGVTIPPKPDFLPEESPMYHLMGKDQQPSIKATVNQSDCQACDGFGIVDVDEHGEEQPAQAVCPKCGGSDLTPSERALCTASLSNTENSDA